MVLIYIRGMQNLSPKGRNGVIVKWIKVETRCLFLETPCVAGDFVRGARASASERPSREKPTHSPQGILRNSRQRTRSPTKPPATQANRGCL